MSHLLGWKWKTPHPPVLIGLKETIAKVLDKDTSLAEKIQMLFREQGIMIASILKTIGMAISVLVEVLLPGATAGTHSKPPSKDEKGVKEWIRNKLKALVRLLGRFGVEAAEALPGIIGGIIMHQSIPSTNIPPGNFLR